MMKFMPALNLALGAFFVLPVATQQGKLEGGLEAALKSSLASIEKLAGIQRDLSDGEVAAVDDLMDATEPAILDGPARDDRLRQLRLDVNRLQMTLDQLEAGGDGSLLVHTPEISLRSTPRGIEIQDGGSTAPPTAGLDSSTRDLVRAVLPRTGAGSQGGTKPSKKTARKRKLEADADYSANKVREGRLLYKAGQHQRALETLEPLIVEPTNEGWEARYWAARCLEKLGRDEEAIRHYEEISKAGEAAGGFADNAKQDYEFLVWKREFFQRRADKAEGKK